MYVARILYPVKVLGPGNRIGIWLSGCIHQCEGCSNPELWIQKPEQQITIETMKELITSITENNKVDGFTITGGDPFYQPYELTGLLGFLAQLHTDILVYTGYQYEDIKKKYPDALQYVSVLIDGKYIQGMNHGAVLRGSDNQRIIILDSSVKDKYIQFLKSERSGIQNFTTADGIISVGIHLPDYKSALKIITRSKGLEEQ